MRKKVISLLLACCLLFSMAAPAMASNIAPVDPNARRTVSPYAQYIFDIFPGFEIVDGTGEVYAYASGTPSVTKTAITARVQQYKNSAWTTVKTYSATSNSSFASTNGSYKLTKGFSYRLELTVKMTVGSTVETEVVESSNLFY